MIDASALVEVLLQTPRSAAVLAATDGSEMIAPDLIVVEALSALRRLQRQRLITATRAELAVSDLIAAPVQQLPTLALGRHTWRLGGNLSVYDACYVALAAASGCVLVSADARLARTPGLPIQVIVP